MKVGNQNANLKSKRRAFTLVELLVVIAIIGILFVVLISKVDFATDKAKATGVQTDFRSYELAAYAIGIEQQGFTSDLEMLTEQLNKNLDPELHLNVEDEHITTQAKDPWGKEYRITYSEPDSSRGRIVITSAGVDTKYDTEDDINIKITYIVDENGGHVEIEMSNGVIEQEPVHLAAGLYDANDNLVASWDELVNTYGMAIERNYTYYTYKTNAASPYYVLTNYTDLASGVKIVISDNVERVGNYAFYMATTLTNVDFGLNITHIGRDAFFGCSGLTGLDIGSKVTSIGDYAFNDCTGLTGELVIPDSVTSIGSYAFADCSGLTSVTIGSGVESIGTYAFNNCTGLTGVYITDLAAWYKIDFSDQSSNPLKYAKNLYLNNAPIVNLVIHDDVTEIKKYTFYNAKNITGTLMIHDGVTSIGSYAFADCSGLTSVTIGSGVESIGSYAFSNCTGLTSVTIGSGVESIGTYAFNNCTGLTGVYITDLAAWCKIDFYNRTSNPLSYAKNIYLNNTPIINLVIPNEITEIKKYAFYYAQNITGTLTIHNGVTRIGDFAFSNCTGLTSVTIGSGVESIGEYSFSGCKGLTGCLVIPDSVTSIGDYAFKGCAGLTGLDIGSKVTSIGDYAFNDCTGLTGELVIPDSVTSIGECAFYDCTGLTGLVLGCGVTTIGPRCFWNCSGITNILICSDYVQFDFAVFQGCNGLKSITIESNVVINFGDYMFDGVGVISSIYVPANLVETYKTQSGWQNYAGVIQAIPMP